MPARAGSADESARRIHQIRLQAENAVPMEEISSSIFRSTVTGQYSTLDSQPSRLWESREQFQSSQLDLHPPVDSDPLDHIIQGIQQLNLQTFQPEDKSPASTAEQNNLNTKAHRSLDKIADRIKYLSIRLSSQTLSAEDIVELREDVGLLKGSLDKVQRHHVESVNVRRIATIASLNGILAHLEDIQKEHPNPINTTNVLKYNSDDHFKASVNSNDSVSQVALFIVVVCNVILGVSRRMGDLVLSLLSVLLRSSFSPSGNFTDWQKDVLQQLPLTTETVLKKFPLQSKTTIYAVCPACHCTYPPTFKLGSSTPIYPQRCTHSPSPDTVCTEQLLEQGVDGHPLPIKTFEYYSFHDYLATLLSRHDLEDVMDKACDDLMASINLGETPTFISDVFDAQFIRNFSGPDGNHFVQRPAKEGRYLFVLNVDFFAAERQTIRGPSASCGLISAACLNLPLFCRYLPENMYIAGIVPGPSEPKDVQLNHYIRPLVDDLKVSWESGVEYSCTAKYPTGRLTRSAIALSVNDLPAARKVNQSISHTSHRFCTRCRCYHRSTLDRTDTDHPDWLPKNVDDLRRDAEAWRSSTTLSEQKSLFEENGLRWTELWRLPYWDPTSMLCVDSMHCLLEGIAQQHFREHLRLTDVYAKSDSADHSKKAFEHTFALPPESWTGNGNIKDRDHILDIHRILLSPVDDAMGSNNDMMFKKLRRQLKGKNRAALDYVMSDLKLEPLPSSAEAPQPQGKKVYSKTECVDVLVIWRKTQPLGQQTNSSTGTLQRIREVIRDMNTPSWIRSVPFNYGMAAAGSLKADEWRTVTTIHIPVALVSLWGDGTQHPSETVSLRLRKVLDHTMDLVCAVSLACKRTMTPTRMDAYRTHIISWLSKLCEIHPNARHSANWHSAMHIYDFLLLFGPVRSWWCFPFERLIGQLQRLPHNHIFGQLESTMLHSFLRGARLRHWLSRPDCPPAVKECKIIFDKAMGNSVEADIVPDVSDAPSSYQKVPADLAAYISESKVRLRARYIHEGTVYCRSSLHVGNSLVMFYPNGDHSKKLVPGCIKYIIDEDNRKLFAVNRQMPIAAGTIDPFKPYIHFPAEIYSTECSADLELIKPDWVQTHYARWCMDSKRAVVLNLSRD